MRRPFNQKTNTGVALFISLVLLLVLTILGVSVVQTTSLEIRMARNEHDSLLAFEAAESALRDAEAALETHHLHVRLQQWRRGWSLGHAGRQRRQPLGRRHHLD